MIRLFTIFVLLCSKFSYSQNFEDPMLLARKSFQSYDYSKPVTELEKGSTEYLNSSFKSHFLQTLATFLSYVGHYKESIACFDRVLLPTPDATPVLNKTSSLNLKDYTKVNAAKEIIQLSKTHQAIFINEAHHVPQHRVLALQILQGLYDNGFRYFAAETLSSIDEQELNKRKYPIHGTGFYTAEPLYADIVRQALRIGYKVVAYEHREKCRHTANPETCQDERERGQANNLINKILKVDPKAKILVHAGYGHIDKMGGSTTFPWIPMAKYFKDFSGINPLSIDQTNMMEHSSPKAEYPAYSLVESHFKHKDSIMLKSKSGHWTGIKGHYDIQVFSPRTSNDLRPHWQSNIPGRIKVNINLSRCKKYPCLIQAFLKNETNNKAIPVDQILIKNNIKQNGVDLFLYEGEYFLRFNVNKQKTINVKK